MGGNGLLDNQDLYQKLQNVVRDKEARRYIEQMDEDGNVYLVEADDPEYDYMDDEDDDERDDLDGGRPAVMMQPDLEAQEYMDDEEFLEMMERDAIRRQGGAQSDMLQQ